MRGGLKVRPCSSLPSWTGSKIPRMPALRATGAGERGKEPGVKRKRRRKDDGGREGWREQKERGRGHERGRAKLDEREKDARKDH